MRQGNLPTLFEIVLIDICMGGFQSCTAVMEEYPRRGLVSEVSYKVVAKTLKRMARFGWLDMKLEEPRPGVPGPQRLTYKTNKAGRAVARQCAGAVHA